jgi:DNA-binding beta-propeller fold protein YncE
VKKKIRIVATALTALMMSPAVFSAPAFAAFQNNASALQSQLLATVPINAPEYSNSNQMAQGPDGTVYVLSGNKVVVISPSGKVENTWAVTSPLTIAVSPDGKTVYVAVQGSYDSNIYGNQLNVEFINAENGHVENTLDTGIASAGSYSQNLMWVSPDGSTLYVGGNGQATGFDVTTGNIGSSIQFNGNYAGMTADGSSVYSLDNNYNGTEVYQANLALGGQVSYALSLNNVNPSFDFPVAVYPYDRRIMTKKGSRTRMTPFVFVIVVT